MKERPILFSAPMVRAILAGQKTQTRRIVKPQPVNDVLFCTPSTTIQCERPMWMDADGIHPGREIVMKHGQPGDRLWVKETSIIAPKRFAIPDKWCIPDSDGDQRYIQYIASHPDTEAAGWYKLKKTPSIFMPRWASRITLEITGVRVERLQAINPPDAIKEGIGITMRNEPPAVQRYAELWDSLNAKRGFGWDVNPWVWVIDFTKI